MTNLEGPARVGGFVLQTAVIVAGMAMGYQMIRSDLESVNGQSQANDVELKELRVVIEKLEVDIKAQEQKLDDFQMVYERDFDTYIRLSPRRSR